MAEARKAKVLLADDHRVCAEALRVLLQSDYDVVGVLTDGRALLEAALASPPDVIIADIGMPLLNGMEVLRRLRRAGVPSKVLMLTMYTDLSFVREAMDAGANGYVLKSSAGRDLISAIDAVLNGQTYLCARFKEALAQRAERSDAHAAGHLTSRQREVLQLMAEGRSSKQIAAILDISIRTVEFHRSSIMDALGLRTVAELTRYAIHQGIISGL